MRCVVVESLLEALLSLVNEHRTHHSKPVIVFDGKVLRDAYRNNASQAVQLVSAYDTENGLVLSQKATPSKKGEITTVREMLEVLNLKGTVWSRSMHCTVSGKHWRKFSIKKPMW